MDKQIEKGKLIFEISNSIKKMDDSDVQKVIRLLGDVRIEFSPPVIGANETLIDKISRLSYGRLIQLRAHLNEAKYKKTIEAREIVNRTLQGRVTWVAPLEFRYNGWEQIESHNHDLIELRTKMQLTEDVYVDMDGDDDNGRTIERTLFTYKLKT